MSVVLSDRFKWVLAIVKLAGYIEGSTRLQKLTFLVSQNVKELAKLGFYTEWVPSKYGPYSEELADDVKLAIESGVIVKSEVRNSAGYLVNCYSLTEEGDRIAQQKAKENPKIESRIHEIIQPYVKAPLMSLLHDVYYQYPQFTSGSTIRAKVAKKSGYADTPLDKQYD